MVSAAATASAPPTMTANPVRLVVFMPILSIAVLMGVGRFQKLGLNENERPIPSRVRASSILVTVLVSV